MSRQSWIRAALGLVLALVLGAAAARAADRVTVFAAASLKTALDAVVADWEAPEGVSVVVSYAGSSALARQIQQGAPADILISASTDWMNLLEAENLIRGDTRVDLLGNEMVLIAHGRTATPVEISRGLDLAGMLGDGRLAMAMVDAVPAGIYGKAALASLGIWDAVMPKVAQADNVRAALALVASGEAPFGIVYATDAVAEDNVTVVGRFPPDSHPPIVYPAALVADSASPAAAGFLKHLRDAAAARIFEAQGFTVLAD